ncbi:MAG: serine/threonine-protein kinase [Polyangiales bacterium]
MWPWRRSDPGSSGTEAPKAGDIVARKYRVEHVLGVGGMGVVVAARHVKLDELVALKLLRPNVVRSRDDVVRFLREGKAASKLKSDHVVRILDLGELPGEVPYLVMEHLEGRDFAAILREHASMGAEMAIAHVIDSVMEACEAVAEAHTLGIVHRDLKPANIFLARMPGGGSRVKVLDFGISKLTRGDLSDPDLSLTQTRTLMGSPIYMAPEVLRSARTADARSDVWAIGCILYELLTGKTPFLGETLTELTAQILEEKPRAPSRFRQDLSPELDEVVLRCLEKKPADRYANAAEVAHALAPFAGSRGAQLLDRLEKIVKAAEIRARTANASMVDTSPALAESTNEGESTLRGWGTTRGSAVTKGRRAAIARLSIAGGAVLLLCGLGIFLAHRSGPSESSAASSKSEPALTVPVAPSDKTKKTEPDKAIASVSASASAPSAAPKPSAAKPKIGPKKGGSVGPNPVFDDPN